MAQKSFLYVANWKAYFTFNQAKNWISSHKQPLQTLAESHHIIICPSFDALTMAAHELKETGIAIAAQDCSAHHPGAYTGQVLAASLAQLGCAYTIIGHSETKKECPENNDAIATKALLLLMNSITPIICVGETAQDYEQQRGNAVIEDQLTPVLTAIAKHQLGNRLIIGYEPLWVIGNNQIPPQEYLTTCLETIKRLCASYAPHYSSLIVYGGGVDETNIRFFKDLSGLDGILIGHASTDFQKLEKIVLS
jgi:triosephosphate isomerase